MKTTGVNRSFGLLLAGFFALLGGMAFWRERPTWFYWIGLAAVLLAVALTVPRVLAPARRAWLNLGRLLGHVANPVLLGAVYVAVIIPVGGLMRLFRRDALARRRAPRAESYWVPGAKTLDAENLKEQF